MKKIAAALAAASLLVGISACSENSVQIEMMEKEKMSPKENLTVSESVTVDKTFENPTMAYDDENVFPDWGIGDPFVLRWNGMYYLYPSARVGSGVQLWTSEDLVNWNYEGFCTTDERMYCAYAPEVVYYNGKFYMCSSPYGNGHYILESDSPLGPFEIVTDNFGLVIDGNFFIDDDGEWYFCSANGDGINAYKMLSPTEVDASSEVKTGMVIKAGDSDDGWTEGSMLIKYNGIYYMTYCGNHVCSNGYRIYYASGTESPLELSIGKNNPILLNTDLSEVASVGHSSTVIGPNLDSLYIIYHSRIAPYRELNMDQLVLNGTYLQAFGPTCTEQQAPEMPDIYSRFNSEESLNGWIVENAAVVDGVLTVSEGGKVLSEKGFADNYTAEFNFLSINGKAGAIFSYTDEKNYGAAYVDTENAQLELIFVSNGTETKHLVPIKGSFGENLDFSVLQQLTVKKCGTEYTFLLNNLTVFEYESDLGGGSVGVASESGEMKVGFVGAEGNVWLSSIKEYSKPIEGEIQAITCIEDDLILSDHDGVNYVKVSGGESYNYYVNVGKTSKYTLSIKYSSTEDVKYELYINGEFLTDGTLPSSENSEISEVIRNLNLDQGYGVLTVKIIDGSADIFNYDFVISESVETQTIDLSQPFYSEGEWTVTENGFESKSSLAKYLYGSEKWEDYTLSATIAPKSKVLMAKFLVRASEAALGDAGTDIELGENYFLGYFVEVTRTNKKATISLNKQVYEPTELVVQEVQIDAGETVDVDIEVYGATIKVYLRGELVIEYTDPDPITTGAVGFQKVASGIVSELSVSYEP